MLARTARAAKIDPSAIRVSDVVAVNNAALLSWNIGAEHGLMGLVRQYDRWWDALDAFRSGPDHVCWRWWESYPLGPEERVSWVQPPSAVFLTSQGIVPSLATESSLHNSDVEEADRWLAGQNIEDPRHRFLHGCLIEYHHPNVFGVSGSGGELAVPRQETNGYDVRIAYSENNAPSGTSVNIYARAPTQAEIIPYPTPLRFVSTAVLYFDLTIEGAKPVTFAPGTTVDIWFPFVLDDTLNYDLTIGFARQPIGPIYAKPFDNVLHYKLPGFTALPRRSLMAEVDGNWP